MANIDKGLFLTPQQVQAQQQAPAMSQQQMQNILRGSLFNLGGAGGRRLIEATGGDPRSGGEKRAALLQGIVSKIDFKDPTGNSIRGAMNVLNQAGFQGEALKLEELIPTAGSKPAIKFETFYDEDSGKYLKHIFRGDEYLGVAGVAKPGAPVKSALRDFYNPKTKEYETWEVKDGVKSKKVGLAEPAKEDNIAWNYVGERETPDGDTVSVRFNPKDDSVGGFQIYVDKGNGPEWTQAPAFMRRDIQRTQEIPVVVEGSKAGQVRAMALIKSDEILGSRFKGLGPIEQKKLAARINDQARKFARDDRSLSMAEARDKALQIAKEQWIKPGTILFGLVDWGTDLKTPQEIQQESVDDGFSIIPEQ